MRDSDHGRRCRASHESRDFPFPVLAEREKIATDDVWVRAGEAVRQTWIVDFRGPLISLADLRDEMSIGTI